MNIKEQLAAKLGDMQAIVDGAVKNGRDLTLDEDKQLKALNEEVQGLKEHIERADRAAELMKSIGALKDPDEVLESGLYGHELHDGQKGHMFLAGRQGQITAKGIARQIRRNQGMKAFLTPGTVTSSVPLLPQGPIEMGRVPTSILDVLRTTVHEGPVFRYLRQTVFTNNAAIVAPGDDKPTSVVTVDDIDGSLQVFAHLSEYVDEYLLRDNDQLADFLARQLLYGLQQKVEQEVVSGAGTAGHLLGLLNTSGIQTQAFATDKLTTLRTAQLKLENLGYTADVFAVNIADWAAIETARNSSGNFDLNGPIDRAAQKIWGTQVVTSGRIPAGTALALDLASAGLDIDTQGIQVKWDTSTGFAKNQIRARVEGRFGLSVYQPMGIVKATITGP